MTSVGHHGCAAKAASTMTAHAHDTNTTALVNDVGVGEGTYVRGTSFSQAKIIKEKAATILRRLLQPHNEVHSVLLEWQSAYIECGEVGQKKALRVLYTY
jgi:hypothetical protein